MSRFAGQEVFVLTGAGISAESGIRTFRDGNGLWEEHRVEDVASPEGFARDPKLVWRFYSERRKQALGCSPNAAHIVLSALEKELGDGFLLATQNVDNLHEKAGSRALLHMHGELFVSRCENARCKKSLPFADTNLYFEEPPRCPLCKSYIRPHIVWFGEVPLFMEEIKRGVQSCDLFLCIGSSGVVYPAAGLVRECIYRRNMGEQVTTIYVGLERPENADSFDEVLLGKAGDVLPTLLL